MCLFKIFFYLKSYEHRADHPISNSNTRAEGGQGLGIQRWSIFLPRHLQLLHPRAVAQQHEKLARLRDCIGG